MQLVRATLCFFCTLPAASLRTEFFYLAGTPAHLLAGSTTTFAVLRAPAVQPGPAGLVCRGNVPPALHLEPPATFLSG